ncbi:TonB-dependent receptor plug domain-containing protein [Planctobacterium marinum]|uniref:TonB-dependent receptor plug domain-containing protein n=1 Tax=Planctobacterium marinum TaxID=1631968 RepID=UPI001E2A3840|nr:TonB-dependent receptor [Planctobacterium marinum]MCC2604498.1 TonB-dependent receptor [Planctobacterium marinum]
MTHIKNVKLTLAAIAVSSAFSASGVQAQENNSIEKISVTGSHIRRTDMEGPSPVASIDAGQIANSGVTDLIGLFTKLPISGQGTFSTQGNSSDDTANGGSSVSLRGLGADSTLILVNGRRVSVSPFAKGIDTAFVDINNIPISAIKRVDILKDGASATYGSDAIAGVINIILKDDFEGFEVSAKYGDTADGGGEEQNFSVIYGTSSDKASHTFILDYFDREEIMYSDRDYSRSANQAAISGVSDAVDFRSSAGIPGTIALASDPTVRMPDTFGNDVCAPEDIIGTLCGYDYAPHMTSVPDTERFSFNYMGKYEISNSVTAFAELNGQNSKSIVRGAASPSFNELFMAGDNPNHPFADDPSHPFYQQDLTMRRRTVDIGNREKRVDTDYYRTILGLEGEFGDWSWELAYSYIKSESVERGVDGFPNSVRIQDAIDSGLWNPFEPSSNSQEALDYIETSTTRVGKSTNKSIDGVVSGPVAEMFGNDVMLAVGFEYREESISDNPDEQFLRGEIFGTEATQANGDRDSTSFFAEVALPFSDTFEAQLALRHEDYSDFGTTTDPKVSFLWSPMEKLSLRGSWGTAFRAPSLHQLGLGRTDESPNLVDTIRCNAVGIDCDPKEYTAVFEGNPDLGPEESTSYNLGMIYEITEDLSFSLDYYNYDIENIIDSDTQFVFSNFGDDPNVVTRLPTADPNDPGEVVQIFDSFQNIGDLQTSGLDLDVQYTLASSMGDFRFGYVMNYVLEYEELRPDADGGKRVALSEGEFEQPEIRWTTSMDWSKDDWSAAVAVNYIGEFDGDKDSGFGDKTVDSMTTVDLTVNYLGVDNAVFTLGSTNLFNEEPPFSHHDFFAFVNTIHSSQGRYVYLKGTYKF